MTDDVFERRTRRFEEVLDDLGAHVVARAGVGSVASYGDVPARLLEAGHRTEPQAHTLRRIIGFRNVLVHDDLEVDLTIVYDVLRNRLDDLRDLHRSLLAAHRRLT